MNLLQQQAKDFYHRNFNESENYEDFIDALRLRLYDYKKTVHKLEIVDQIMLFLKKDYDEHLKICRYPDQRDKCGKNKNYENTLFFVQNERDELIESLEPTEFTIKEKSDINLSLEKIISDLDKIQTGQEITYDDLYKELTELKEFYYLNKKHWSQLLIGKLSEMVAGGVISETLSKEIVKTVADNYDGFIQ